MVNPADTASAPEPAQPSHAAGPAHRRWVQNVLPLATSLSLHVGVVAVGVALYQAVGRAAEPDREQVVFPETARLTPTALPGGVPHPGIMADPSRMAAQDEIHTDDVPGFAADRANKLAAAGGAGDTDGGFVGAESARGFGRRVGTGTGGGTAPWGMPGGGDRLAPQGLFQPGAGVPAGGANDVVFLCDASGSMVGVFGQLKVELKRSIAEMSVDEDAVQRFNVIFFNDGNAVSLFPGGLQLATPANKAAAAAFIDDQVSTGGTDPMPAIKMALGEHPQLLYVLTDGFDQVADLSTVVDQFRRGDPGGKTHVNCIYLQSGDADGPLVAALKKIADAGHGTLRTILKKDM